MHLSFGDLLNAYTLLGGLATAGLFLFYGAVFVTLKTEGAVRDDAVRFAAWSGAAGDGAGGRRSGCGRRWPTATTGRGWCSAVAVIAQLTAVMLVWSRGGDGWAFVCTMTVVAAVVVLLFGIAVPESGAVDAESGVEPDDLQRIVDRRTR